jgi:hypothetical protein
MPTKKQRRRQQKSRRHEYEYVYVDDEGNEVAVDPAELRPEKDAKKTDTPARQNGAGRTTGRTNQRVVQPPSWRRAVKRAFIYGAVFIAAMALLNRNNSSVQWVSTAIFLIPILVPMVYFSESIAYKAYRKRIERGAAKPR